jgi:hypothetical protein
LAKTVNEPLNAFWENEEFTVTKILLATRHISFSVTSVKNKQLFRLLGYYRQIISHTRKRVARLCTGGSEFSLLSEKKNIIITPHLLINDISLLAINIYF